MGAFLKIIPFIGTIVIFSLATAFATEMYHYATTQQNDMSVAVAVFMAVALVVSVIMGLAKADNETCQRNEGAV